MVKLVHISDMHATKDFSKQGSIDKKVDLPRVESSFEKEFFDSFEKYLEKEHHDGKRINLFIISGDIVFRGDLKAHATFSKEFIGLLKRQGYSKNDVMVVPGNHDVKQGTLPSSQDRYRDFLDAWKGCKIPYLDGCNNRANIFIDDTNHVIVIPVNSCNWSHTKINVDEAIQKHIDSLKNEKLKEKFEKQFTYDAAYISEDQLKHLEKELQKIKKQKNYNQYTKVIVQHHHLLPVDDKIEIKELSDIINLKHLQKFIIEHEVKVILHGHKHTGKSFYEYLSYSNEPYKILIGSAENVHYGSIFNELCIEDKSVEINSYSKSLDKRLHKRFDLYGYHKSSNIIRLEEKNIHDLYEQICFFSQNSHKNNKTIITTLDLEKYEENALAIPKVKNELSEQVRYEREIASIVEWWQKDSSNQKVAYQHGTRLRKYHGFKNQIEYIQQLFQKNNLDSSRGIAILTEPIKDFDGYETEFPSFVSLQFLIRDDKYLDLIGYYRVQETRHWWPINILELFTLQSNMLQKINEINKNVVRGKLTTIAASVRFHETYAFGHSYISRVDILMENDPTRLAAISNALFCNIQASEYVNDWDDIFTDLQKLKQSQYNPDGNAFPISGLEYLYDFLKKIKTNSEQQNKFVNELERLNDVIALCKKSSNADEFGKNLNKYQNCLDSLYNIYKNLKDDR